MFYCFEWDGLVHLKKMSVTIAHHFLELWECRVTLLHLYPFVDSLEALKFHSTESNLTLRRESFLSHSYKVILLSLNLFFIITCLFSQTEAWKGHWGALSFWSLDCLILLILFGPIKITKGDCCLYVSLLELIRLCAKLITI